MNFEIRKKNGAYYFTLVNKNGVEIATSRNFSTKKQAINTVKAIQDYYITLTLIYVSDTNDTHEDIFDKTVIDKTGEKEDEKGKGVT